MNCLILRHKSTHVSKHLNLSKSPLKLVGNRYNPPQSMSKNTARKWAQVGSNMAKVKDKYGKDISKAPVDIYGIMYDIPGTVDSIDTKFSVKELAATVDTDEHEETFSELAAKKFNITVQTARFLILKGEIWVSGSAHSRYVDAKPEQPLHAGDQLKRIVRFKKVDTIQAVNDGVDDLKASILYKDERIIIINKPAQMAVQCMCIHNLAGSKHKEWNLDTLLANYDKTQEPLRLVHRLDRDTTGCLILARTKDAAAQVSKLFQDESNSISKRVFEFYFSICR